MSTLPSSPARLAPQQRLESLCDRGSLQQIESSSESVNVVAARGRVSGRPIVCYAQDSSIAGGSVGLDEADVIVQALRHGRRAGVPVVGFLESAGARLQDGAGALDGFGRIFSENVALSGHAPQISVITGTAAGGGCYSPALTDFVVMSNGSSMFLTGPKIVKHALGEDVSSAELGGANVHQQNGVCDFVCAGDAEAIGLVRELLGYLPQNAHEPLRPARSQPPLDGANPAAPLPERSRNFYDVREVIRRLVDAGRFLEVSLRWGRNMVVGFARLQGHPIAIVANQARYLGGIIDVVGSQKGARFVRTCDAFGLPLLVLVDTPGFMPGTHQERAGVIRHGAELVRAFAAARSPRATVILRKAFGGAFITMNSKGLGADATFSWPDAEIGIMSAGAAVEIIHHRLLRTAEPGRNTTEELIGHYAQQHLSARAALRRQAIHAVIEPSETRERVAEVLLGAQRTTPPRAALTMRSAKGSLELVSRPGARTGPTRSGKSVRRLTLSRLQRLEAESIHILREAVSEAENPVMLYSVGKDSSVMLHLALRAFHPAKPPFPLLHVDTGWKFREMYAFRDRIAAQLGLELRVHTNQEGVAQNINPFDHGPEVHTHIMKTVALRQALDEHRFDMAFGGARRDEEKSRAKERIFSVRSAQHTWNPKQQRPELWRTYNTRLTPGASLRVFPLSNWTELDVWLYVQMRQIPVVPLYFAAPRPVVERDGVLIMVDDERLPLRPDERPSWKRVRFRTLGCYPLTGAIESEADTVSGIIAEMVRATTSERHGRVIDHDSAASIERKKQEGYF